MKKSNHKCSSLYLFMGLVVLGLVGCGGGEEETLTVGTALRATNSSLFPAPGSAQKTTDTLSQAGVSVVGKKCSTFFSRDQDGNELLTVGGTPTYILLVDIKASGLDTAKALGFSLLAEDYLKSVNEIFECESRRL